MVSERSRLMTRRQMLGTVSGCAASIGSLVGARAASDKPVRGTVKAMRLGGPIFQKIEDPEALARTHRDLGYRAAYCPNIPLSDSKRLRETEAAFRRHDVVLAEVGRWVNLMDADPAKRAENLRLVQEGLALAEEVGARCCVDIAGSKHPTIWYGPDPANFLPAFFDEAVENARKIIDAVRPKRAKFCYEMMGWAMPESADRYVRMIRAVDRKGFGVHLDPCNLVNSAEKFYRNRDLIDECFQKLGRWIVSCHAKDLIWEVEMNLHFREVRPGLGKMDHGRYLRQLAAMPEPAPLMMEHLSTAQEYDQAREYLMGRARELGLSFGV